MSEITSPEFWQQLYENGETAWDIGFVSPPLKTYFDQIEDKALRILIPGCGNSYEAEYLMQQGFKDLTVIDIAEEPVNRLKQVLADYEGKELEILHGDFFTCDFADPFDLVREQTFFCALDRRLRPVYVERMSAILKQGGLLAGVLFKTEFQKEGPPFGGSPDEYKQLFSKKFEIAILEDCYNSHPKRQDNELFISLINK